MLYQDSRITVGESLALTMAFIVWHKLSTVASNDLISLLELHCPKENNAVKGLSQFKEHFQYLKHPMKKHFCCPNPKCQVYISVGKPKDGDVCRICSGPLSDKSFFIELPVEDQLQTILSRKLYIIRLYTVVVQCMHYSKNPGFSRNFWTSQRKILSSRQQLVFLSSRSPKMYVYFPRVAGVVFAGCQSFWRTLRTTEELTDTFCYSFSLCWCWESVEMS